MVYQIADLFFNRNHWVVLIDAAKGCATQPPDLSKFPADFVVISFYKVYHHVCVCVCVEALDFSFFHIIQLMILFLFYSLLVKLFGYPTGLGALIARKGK